MNRTELIKEFLLLIKEIANNDIGIDSNLVYSNLINFWIEKEDISHYFTNWINNFKDNKKIDIIDRGTYLYFNSYGFNHKSFTNVKIYVPVDKTHIYNAVNDIITFMIKNDIMHSTRVFNTTRMDDIIITVPDLLSAEKVRKYIYSNEYIKSGLFIPNPYAYTDKYISFVWDGHLSYNTIVSEYISDYINDLKLNNRLNNVGYNDFYDYIKRRYELVFNKGIGINKFINSRKFINIPKELYNYKLVTEMFIDELDLKSTLKTFSAKYKSIKEDKEEENKLKLLVTSEILSNNITSEQKEIFDYSYIELCKNYKEEYVISCFKTFVKDCNYRIFKRNIRQILIKNEITPIVMREIIYEEMKTSLINASLKTISKYDSIQLGKALFGIRNDDYSSFTNENNARLNLQLMVSPKEIDELLETFLNEDGYLTLSSDDNYWVFIELIDKMNKEE